MWKVAADYTPGRDTYYYRFFDGGFSGVFGFRVVCVVEDESEAQGIALSIGHAFGLKPIAGAA
jgi:hypothetical protein